MAVPPASVLPRNSRLCIEISFQESMHRFGPQHKHFDKKTESERPGYSNPEVDEV